MLLLDIQKAIQSEETFQNLFRSNESAYIDCEEISDLRYHKRCYETYNKTLATDTFHSGERDKLIIYLGYQSGSCLRLHRGQLTVFHFIGAFEYIHWNK